uniref:Uncharacterized protein n=2 Tax=Acrobeloides nanus TaxID=290746 RepID=A0A914CC06_9BILA
MRDSEVDLPNDEHALRLIIREADYYQVQALIDYIQGSQIIVDSKRESRTLAELCEIMNCKKPIVVITYFGPMTPEHFLTIEIVNKLKNLLISYPTVNVYYVEGPQPIPGAYRPDILDVFVNGSRIYSESISHINYPNKEIWWNIVKNKLTDVFNKAW